MRALMFLSMMLWGLTWTASKVMVDQQVDPLQIVSIKCGIVTLSFLPFMFYLKIPFSIPKSAILPTLLIGVFNTVYNYLLLAGLHYGEAGSAGVIAEVLSPIFATFIWSAIKKNSLLRNEKIGLFLGIVSGAFLVDITNYNSLLSPFNAIYVLAALMWASLTISSRYATENSHPIVINFYSSVFPFVIFLPSLFFTDTHSLGNVDYKFWLCMFSVTILSTTFATTIFYKGIKVLGVTQGGIFVLLVPLGALLFAWIFLGEIPQIHTVIGGLIALVAIYLINFYLPTRMKSYNKS
ncbi:DMT family transporter [Helicobacter cappadocius]|uniref:DMT family transporter n=1 Tax=Helicobacter cappadocius TaxID=3063998 RepID=A0AA90TE09_9HELI|nr:MULTISPECIES: DMT family transporter [unclassified Helicobacter]MDO7252353.1 DMT family transporter [Helicobacter sp. faydin-H75]MDP2538220.1 DMT family transporter [Helicobacter sp. faydin-H76]